MDDVVRVPEDLRYTATDLWVRAQGGDAVVGLTDHAQRAVGDVVYVDLIASHTRLHTMEVMGEVESIKVVFELRAPFTASIASVNGALWDEPELVNSDPYGEGWLVTLRPDRPHDLFALLDAPAYAATLPGDAGRPPPPGEDERARLWHPDVGGAEWVCVRRVASAAPDAPRVCLMAYDGWSQREHAASALSRWRAEENRFECTVADALSLLELSGFQRLPRGRLDEPTP